MAPLGPRDLELLRFAARHRLILAAHAGAALGVSARTAAARLRTLTEVGWLEREPARFRGRPACYLVTAAALTAIGSPLPKPRFDLGTHDHDVGMAWLDLAARAGKFGATRRVISEREMRSFDARADRDGPPLGVRLGGLDARGRDRVHYPDMLLELASGHRIAIELELSGKGRGRREQILSGYAADSRIDAVVYLAENAAIRRNIRASAARLGISSRVLVHRCAWPRPPERPSGRGRARQRSGAGREPEAAAR